jgi:hypothetical protein
MTQNEILRRWGKSIPPDTAIPDAEQRERKKTLAVGGEGKAQGPGLLHCRFTLRRRKMLDVDAKYASVKDLLDCLTIARIIPGDKESQISLEVNQEQTSGQEETVVEVFETLVILDDQIYENRDEKPAA